MKRNIQNKFSHKLYDTLFLGLNVSEINFFGRFEEGAEQFRLDVAQNPNDTEESIWCFLCEARLYRVDKARDQFLEASL